MSRATAAARVFAPVPPRHEGVEHCLRAVEVGRQPPASVAVKQRVQADVGLALQMRGQHCRGQRQVVTVLVPDALAPPAAYRRDPAGLPGPLVVVPDRVHVGPRREQCAEERYLRVLRRPVMHNPRSGLEEGSLRRAGRGSLLRGEPQQLQQPLILRPQPRQLSLNRHRDLTHDDTLSANDHALNRHQRKQVIAAD